MLNHNRNSNNPYLSKLLQNIEIRYVVFFWKKNDKNHELKFFTIYFWVKNRFLTVSFSLGNQTLAIPFFTTEKMSIIIGN